MQWPHGRNKAVPSFSCSPSIAPLYNASAWLMIEEVVSTVHPHMAKQVLLRVRHKPLWSFARAQQYAQCATSCYRWPDSFLHFGNLKHKVRAFTSRTILTDGQPLGPYRAVLTRACSALSIYRYTIARYLGLRVASPTNSKPVALSSNSYCGRSPRYSHAAPALHASMEQWRHVHRTQLSCN